MEKAHRPTHSKAIVFVLVAVVSGTLMDTLLKVAGAHVGTWQLLVLRWSFALLVLLPVILTGAAGSMRIQSWHVHIARGLLNCLGSYALFYALATLPLSVVITILFAEPLFVIPFAVLILHERVGTKDVLAALLGLVGVVVMSQPDVSQGDWKMLLPLVAASSFALLNVLTKKWGAQESPVSLMLWMAVSTLLITIPFAASQWVELRWQDYGMALAIAVLGSVYSYFWIVGLRMGNVAKLTQLSFLSLPLAFGLGWAFFHEAPGAATVWGALIIAAAVMLLSMNMARVKTAHVFLRRLFKPAKS